jgi:hypothetical protein
MDRVQKLINPDYILVLTILQGHDITEAVVRWFPTAAARVRSQVRSYWICGGHTGTGAGSSIMPWYLYSRHLSTPSHLVPFYITSIHEIALLNKTRISQLSEIHCNIYVWLASHLCSILGHVIWNLWQTKWHWGRFSPSTSVSPANSHCNSSIFINISIVDAV